jgi:hypothetical protein
MFSVTIDLLDIRITIIVATDFLVGQTAEHRPTRSFRSFRESLVTPAFDWKQKIVTRAFI